MKSTKVILCGITGYSLINALLIILIVIKPEFFQNTIYHYADNITYYMLFAGLPLLGGCLAWYLFKKITVPNWIQLVLICGGVLQILFILITTRINYTYWGYPIKRPILFQEVIDLEKINKCTYVTNSDSLYQKTTLFISNNNGDSLEKLYGRSDMYVGLSDRIFMNYEDKKSDKKLPEIKDIYDNPEKKTGIKELAQIDLLINNSGIIDKGDGTRDTTGEISGYIVEFETNNAQKYIYAGMHGRQVTNDHYPFYEFLFEKNGQQIQLIDKQRFYTDIAGREGFEYVILSPVFSALLCIVTGVVILVVFIILKIVYFYRKMASDI